MSTRILIADDHPILRDGVRLLLQSESDLEVVGQAPDGAVAIRMAVELKPDVILMDIQMPQVDGIEACTRILEQLPGIRVLILSQLDSEEHLARVLEAGAQGYLLKQSATDELINAVRTVAGGQVYMTPLMASRLVNRYLHRAEVKPAEYDHLTSREKDVLSGICDGLTNQQIADHLILSIKTVQSHRANIMEKLNLHNRIDLVKYAIRTGLCKHQGAPAQSTAAA